MAIILIVEDRPSNRKLLTAILRSGGHDVIEASDGNEALDILAHTTPDIVISDILMPTVDGYELARRMRDIPALAETPVIFHTATYHEHEARALADQCGVFDILTKPSDSRVILATVDAALLSRPGIRGSGVDDSAFDREHARVVSSRLAATIDRWEAEKERMSAVLQVTEQIAAQQDPPALLKKVCIEARHVTLAQHAVVGLLNVEGSAAKMLYTSGFDAATAVGLTPPSIGGALLTAVVGERRPVRRRNAEGRPEALGLPSDHPRVSSLLSVPIASSKRVYGWLSLRNKLGADEFSEVDERAAVALGVHAGIAFENVCQTHDLHRRVTALEVDLQRTAARVREEERSQLSRTLHDQMGQALAGLKMDLHRVAGQLALSIQPPRNDIADNFHSILQRLDEAIASVRTTASGLRPAIPDKRGLVAAIERQAEEYERRYGIRCRVNSRIDDIDLEPPRATAILRIVQEALTNALQHANCTRATVTVRRLAGSLTVAVADNGRGISVHDLANGRSLGLIGMRERAALLGGRLVVRKGRKSGTVVSLTVPLTEVRRGRG